MTRILCALVLASSSLATAQQHPIIGTWEVNYAAGLRMENGAATPMMAAGVLTVVAQGDSLIGELVTTPSATTPARPATRLAAAVTSGAALVFISHSEARMNMNGEEHTTKVVSTWKLTVTGNALEGTTERSIEGMDMGSGGPQPVTGTRRSH